MATQRSLHPATRTRRAAVALAALAVLAGAVVVAAPAQAAPPDFQLVSGNPDFGFVKEGSVVTQTFSLLNDGDDDIIIDPTGLGGLNVPFVVTAIDFTGHVIPQNGHASFTVRYTAPTAGTNTSQPIVLTATDQTDLSTTTLPITFTAKSLATDPGHFAITNSGGGSGVDFSSLTVGDTVKRTVTLSNDGVIPLRFMNSALTVEDESGAAVPSITISNSSFGDAGAVYQPGESATFDLTYTPTESGSLSATVHIVGVNASTFPELPNVIEDLDVVGSAAAVTPSPTPTPTPTPTSTPPATITGTGSSHQTTSMTTTTSSQLASTGLATQSPVLIGAAITSLGVTGVLIGIAYRRFARKARR
ncbi:MAG: hypothetical protein JWQ64_2974 [Subtercola sp.]|nr:hypothetical protein [Subtercola sp.]